MMSDKFPQLREELLQANKSWDVEKLFVDLGKAKKTLVPRSKSLSSTEKIFLCLLLCENSPETIAQRLHRDVNGVKTELSKGLYSYIEIFLGQRPKNWRQIIIWFEQRGYKFLSSGSELVYKNYKEPSEEVELTEIQANALKDLEVYKRYSTLVGREKEISNIYYTLTDDNSRRIVAIDGIGGVGKTALAREIAIRSLKKGDFYSVIWSSAKPEEFTVFGRRRLSAANIDFDKLLNQVACNIGYLDVYSIQDLHEKRNFVRKILDEQQYLVVIDNLETVEGYIELVQNLEGLFNKSRAILTSRQVVSGSRHVSSCRIGGLSQPDSLVFLNYFASDLDRAREVLNSVDKEKLIEIHKLTGGLPLAMELVVGKIERGYTIDSVFAGLKSSNYQVINNVAASDEDIYQEFYRFIYQDSWDKLSEKAKDLLICIGEFSLNEGAKIGKLLDISELRLAEMDNIIAELVQFSLVKCESLKSEPVLYLHPLTYLFVQRDAE